jgi:hypothetical protein
MRALLAVLTFACAACGRGGLAPRPPGLVPDASHETTLVASDPVDAAAADDAAAPTDLSAAAESRPEGDTSVAPWPAILRLENIGANPVALPANLVALCSFQLTLSTADGAHQTSATSWDTWCPCSACRNGRTFCEFVDFICDGSPTLLGPGDHLDLPWDGTFAVKLDSPSDTGCAIPCDAWQMVGPGRYVFQVSSLGRVLSETEVALPSATGIVELPLCAD